MVSQLAALGGCIESAQIECWFGRDLDGSVVYEQWSVWVTPNAEANPWCQDAGSYGDAARMVRELTSYGAADFVREGPFPVAYVELGSRVVPSVPPVGMTFKTHHGTALEYAE
jgi:hypothetical protein